MHITKVVRICLYEPMNRPNFRSSVYGLTSVFFVIKTKANFQRKLYKTWKILQYLGDLYLPWYVVFLTLINLIITNKTFRNCQLGWKKSKHTLIKLNLFQIISEKGADDHFNSNLNRTKIFPSRKLVVLHNGVGLVGYIYIFFFQNFTLWKVYSNANAPQLFNYLLWLSGFQLINLRLSRRMSQHRYFGCFHCYYVFFKKKEKKKKQD